MSLSGCNRAAPPAAEQKLSAEQQFGQLEHEYVVYFMSRFPVVATYLGGAAFDTALANVDGTLRDYSPQAIAAEDRRWSEFKQKLTALDPQALSARRQIDRTVALAQIEFLLHQHQARRYPERALDSYIDEPFRGVDWQIQGMTSTGPDTYGTAAEWQQVLARAKAIPAYLQTAERQLQTGIDAQNTPDWRVLEQYGLQSAAADADYFAKTLPALAQKNLPEADRDRLLPQILDAGAQAAGAYNHLHDFVRASFFGDVSLPGAAALKPAYREDRFAVGEEEYDWALHNNLRLQTTAGELYEQAQPIIEKTQAEMFALAAEIARAHKLKADKTPGATVQKVFAAISADAPRTDAEMIENYRKTGERLVDYARRTGLFDVPPEYKLEVTITPPPLRSSIEGAAYYPAPPFKKSGVGRFYVTPTDNDPVALRQEHNRAALPDLAAHEGFPGHDWHFKVMAKYRDSIAPVRWLTPGAVEDSSSMWQDSMAAEGWALYSEALLAEPQPGAPHGFYSPEEHLYQLRGKLYRDLRVRIDTGIHTGRLSFEDAVTLFSNVVDFLPGSCTDARALRNGPKRASCSSARAAVTRYSRWPTQAITYRLGKDQIYALRQKAQEQLGERFSEKRFHMEFMKQGTIPASYFGAELLKVLAQ